MALFIGAGGVSSSQATEMTLVNANLSTNINAYTSVQYKLQNTQSRQLSFAGKGGGAAQLVISQRGNQWQLERSSPTFRALFQPVQQKGNFGQIKGQFFHQDGQNEIDALNEDVAELTTALQTLQQEISVETDADDKMEQMDELATISSEKNRLQRQVTTLVNRKVQLSTYPVYDLSQVFTHQYQGDFFLVEGDMLLLVNTAIRKLSYRDPLSKQIVMATELRYDVVAEANVKTNKISHNKPKNKLTLIRYQDTLLALNYAKQQLLLTRLEDAGLTAFARMIATLPLEPSKFEVKGEQLKTQYVWSEKGNHKTLDVFYKETGKRKNLIQVTASAETNVFDPKVQSKALEKHIGVLLVKGERLIEVKKVQTINGKKDTTWSQDIRSGIIQLGAEKIFVSKAEYYGYEGLWYLASWMSTNSITEKKIFLINGTEPISLTATLTNAGLVDITKSGKSLYQFSVDKNGFVTRLYFSPLEQELRLISKETTTTKANRVKVARYMELNRVVLL